MKVCFNVNRIKYKMMLMIVGLCLMNFTTVISQTRNLDLSKPGNSEQVIGTSPEKGTISIVSTGFGKNAKQSIKDAIEDGFETILYIGVPGSLYPSPLVENKSEVKNNPFINALWDGDCMNYIIRKEIISSDKKTRKDDGEKGIETKMALTINYDALRSYLEKNNVISTFGY